MRRWATGLLLAATIGCGSGDGVAPVRGTVKFKGEPVAGAQVMFTPAKGAGADATTDAGGKYALNVAVGASNVTVTKMVRKNADDPYSPADNALPARYAQGETSGITKEVARGGSTIDLDLTE